MSAGMRQRRRKKGFTVPSEAVGVEPIAVSLARPSTTKHTIPYTLQELWRNMAAGGRRAIHLPGSTKCHHRSLFSSRRSERARCCSACIRQQPRSCLEQTGPRVYVENMKTYRGEDLELISQRANTSQTTARRVQAAN